MALHAKTPRDPGEDREIFRQTLEAYKAALSGSQDAQKEIII